MSCVMHSKVSGRSLLENFKKLVKNGRVRAEISYIKKFLVRGILRNNWKLPDSLKNL